MGKTKMAGGTINLKWKRPSESRAGFRFWVSDKAKQTFDSYRLKGTTLIERDVVIEELDFVGLHTQFRQRGWVSVCSGNIGARPVLVKEFLANVTSVDPDGLPLVHHPQWPLSHDLLPVSVELQRELTGGVYTKLPKVQQGQLAPHYRLLNKIVCAFIDPSDNISHISPSRQLLLYGIGRGYSFDLATKIWKDVYQYTHHPPGTSALPYISLLTRFMVLHSVPIFQDEPLTLLKPPITPLTLQHSNAHTFKSSVYMPRVIPKPRYPQVEAAYPPIFLPSDYVPIWLQPDQPAEIEPPPTATLPNATIPDSTPLNSELMAFLQQQFQILNGRLDVFGNQLDGFNLRLNAMASHLVSLEKRVGEAFTSSHSEDEDDDDAADEGESEGADEGESVDATEGSENEDENEGSEDGDTDMDDDA
ncbi:hypothetical protein Vadar_017946 [Vaccinium darrowii]|uniref:Uncharacterized protein n=1 Tax=Vaccinium darrowii TaxID=229202 RepID=A0ACB7Y097_9ERIC|nr:hypothetical protein Vadar_017946 [Vaccinium darrowii]